MVVRQVVARFANAAQRTAARQAMTKVDHVTEAFVLGSIDQARIDGLEKQGVRIEILDEKDFAAAGTFDIAPEPTFYVLQIRGPLAPSWRKQLEARNARLLSYVPPWSYTVHLTAGDAEAVRKLPFVVSLRRYGPADKGPASARLASTATSPDRVSLARVRRADPRGGERILPTHEVLLHRAEDLSTVVAWLGERSCPVPYAKNRKLRVAIVRPDVLEGLKALPEVAQIADHVPPTLLNDRARQILGIDPRAQGAPAAPFPYTGAGEVIGVADSGIDLDHPDLRNRPDFPDRLTAIPRARERDASDPIGHGTHVIGSIIGDGAASGGVIRGVAPAARMIMQSITDVDGQIDLPPDLAELLQEAYDWGARIHNNSWGSSTGGALYTIQANEMDDFVRQHPDMLIVVAAGNTGEAYPYEPRNAAPGFVEWGSINSPAIAKNVLAVGASRSTRSDGGYRARLHGELWDSFPVAPIRDQPIAGDVERLAGFSSRGPTGDKRVKPDVVAPGTNIVSTRASTAPPDEFWGPYPRSGRRYAYMGGTSMAAPLVAGCAALVREYYRKAHRIEPSAALLKATLINGTRVLAGEDAWASNESADRIPNFDQGFGLVWMPTTIPTDGGFSLAFVDPWATGQPTQFPLGRTTPRRYRIVVRGGAELRSCLTWLDVPGVRKQNNLDLQVEHSETAELWRGNAARHRFDPASEEDAANTVEVIRLQDPRPGVYVISIWPHNLIDEQKDFALVVTGMLEGSIAEIPDAEETGEAAE